MFPMPLTPDVGDRVANTNRRVCIASAYALALTVGIIGRIISCKHRHASPRLRLALTVPSLRLPLPDLDSRRTRNRRLLRQHALLLPTSPALHP